MPKAILSVHDKSGLIPFAQGLHELGWQLIASGGTARLLKENNLPVSEVAEYTSSPEILGGRVKTLHPAIHGGLLARDLPQDQQELKDHGWAPIDLVAVNLYPFEATIAKPGVTFEEAIENIDIGGVTLIRAAAKNHQRVTLVCDPADYPQVLSALQQNSLTSEVRKQLAVKGFLQTTRYDQAISHYLGGENSTAPLSLNLHPVQSLRYGENPHQKAVLYGYEAGATPLGGKILQGKELSYNNLLDLDAAWRAAVAYDEPAVAIVKHLSPCGIAVAENITSAFQLALACDPVSAFGGVIACNKAVDKPAALAMTDLFVECVIAPDFSEEALQLLAKKKNCRLVKMPNLDITPRQAYRSVTRGVLCQDVDLGDPAGTEWKVVSARQPTAEEMESLRFAWTACRSVKSNAIVFAKGTATVGIGGGQPNRVDCVKIAAQRAGMKAQGAVMASDAFFPFPDSVEIAAQAGITAVIHPGGSVRDSETIAFADQNQIAVVTTGVRHFCH